jgi:RNA recognition motif-containing protein
MADKDCNLIINYIPLTLNDDQLRHLFMGYGNVESVKVVKDKMTQRSLGYGFVKFSNASEAKAAIDGLNGRQLENKTLKVAVSKPPNDEKLSNLYIAGLEPHLTKEDLATIFQSYGNVQEAKILVDKSTGSARGIGFVKFESSDQADAAIKALNGVTLAGTSKPLSVRVAEKKDNKSNLPTMPFGRQNVRYNPMSYMQQPFQFAAGGYGFPGFQQQQMGGQSSGNVPSFCLFVYNLPPESDDNYLYQLFGPYGAVANVKVARDPGSNLCKGFGFVNMVKVEDAQSAIAALNGAQIGTKNLQVSFKKDK